MICASRSPESWGAGGGVPSNRLGYRMVKSRRLQLSPKDILQVVDVVCSGEDDSWVSIIANQRGRTAIEAIFPDLPIDWLEPPVGFPAEWRSVALDVPGLANQAEHLLPRIYNDAPLDEASPDAVAFVLAMAAKIQGARGALFTEADGLS